MKHVTNALLAAIPVTLGVFAGLALFNTVGKKLLKIS